MKVVRSQMYLIRAQRRKRRWGFMHAVRNRKILAGVRPNGKEFDAIDMIGCYGRWNTVNLADTVAAHARAAQEAALNKAAELRDSKGMSLLKRKPRKLKEDRISAARTLDQRAVPLLNLYRSWYIRAWVARLRISVLTANAAAMSIQGRYRLWTMHCAVAKYRAQREYAAAIVVNLFRERIGLSRRGSLSRERHAAATRIQRLCLRTISRTIWKIERERHHFPSALRHGSTLFLESVTGAFLEAEAPRRVVCTTKKAGVFQRWTVWQRKPHGKSRHAMLQNSAMVRFRSSTGEWLTACGVEGDAQGIGLRRGGLRKDQWFIIRKHADGKPVSSGDEVTIESCVAHKILTVESEDGGVSASRAPRMTLSAWSVFIVRKE